MILALIYLLVCFDHVSSSNPPIVTLRHGGKLQGRTTTVDGRTADQFIGIPYAKPPIGQLRFRKPQAADAWAGVKLVDQFYFNACVQDKGLVAPGIEHIGSEDCLYLDITVPQGVNNSHNKHVMIWIHGGGYTVGTGMVYVGAPLSVHGDVVIVTINYRLGVFGFLSESPGTGNFGLWDQRAAILWVKENIAEFGGNPESITIFGQSAGAGSVAAQLIGQHNNGLFQRAICQSGSLYQSWGWYLSDKNRICVKDHLAKSLDCTNNTLYNCLREKTVDEIWRHILKLPVMYTWHPVPDNDFFPSNVNDETYELSQRFDLMAGFTGQENANSIPLLLYPMLRREKLGVENKLSFKLIRAIVRGICSDYVAQESTQICTEFAINYYGLDQAQDGQDALVRISVFFGELNINADMTRLLMKHVNEDTKTYAYRFTDYVKVPSNKSVWGVPEWGKISAEHGDDLAFLFGVPFMTDATLESLYSNEDDMMAKIINSTLEHFTEAQVNASRIIMSMWTNFAKTGDPNKPVRLPDQPVWPAFENEIQRFLDISKVPESIAIPEKERLDRMLEILFSARRRAVESEKLEPGGKCIGSLSSRSNKTHKGNYLCLAILFAYLSLTTILHR